VSRFTVQHVTREPSLVALAEAYLRDYSGDFSYLLEAKRNVLHNFRLHDSVIKGVLNCMLGDPTVVDMPQPGNYRFDASQHIGPRTSMDDYVDNDWPRPPAPPPLPKVIGLKTRWRMTHGVINSKQARAIHMVDTEWSGARYSPDTGAINWRLRWLCKPHPMYYSPLRGQFFLLRYDQMQTTLRLKCLTMSPTQFGKVEMLGGLLRDWRECRQCVLRDGLNRGEIQASS
jgi:hypothetical protein